MVQYLYAAYSLGGPQVPEKYQAMIRGWQEVIFGIAKEEMGHLLSVQNVLKLYRRSAEFQPRGLSLGLAVLSVSVLARAAHAPVAGGICVRRVAGRLERQGSR